MPASIAHLELVPPLVFRLTAFLQFATSALMIGLHTLIIGAASQRADLAPATRTRAPLAAAATLALWFAAAVMLADVARFPLLPQLTRLQVALPALIGPIALGVVALFSSRSLRAINAATPSHWLIAPQTYRLLGGMFLYPFLYYGVLPGGFAWPAAIGDMLVGALAPFVALAVARGTPRASTWALLWNVFGLVDLVVAPVSAVVTHAAVADIYPLALVPLFLGPPLAVLLHVFSLRNLWVTRPLSRARRSGELVAAGARG